MIVVTRAWMYLPGRMTSHEVMLDGPRAGWSWCGVSGNRPGLMWLSDESRLAALPRCRTCAGGSVQP